MRPSYLHKLEQVLTAQVSLPTGKPCLELLHRRALLPANFNSETKLIMRDSNT